MVLIFISPDSNNFYDKTHIQGGGYPAPVVQGVAIAKTGSFVITKYCSDPHDLISKYIFLYVVPATFDVSWPHFQQEGGPLRSDVITAAVASLKIDRTQGVVPGASSPAASKPGQAQPSILPPPRASTSPLATSTIDDRPLSLDFTVPPIPLVSDIVGTTDGNLSSLYYAAILIESPQGVFWGPKARVAWLLRSRIRPVRIK
jgi:hypothetical protein